MPHAVPCELPPTGNTMRKEVTVVSLNLWSLQITPFVSVNRSLPGLTTLSDDGRRPVSLICRAHGLDASVIMTALRQCLEPAYSKIPLPSRRIFFPAILTAIVPPAMKAYSCPR